MSVYLFLWASPNFPVWNQVFNISFILCMSNVLSISRAAIIPSAGETGWKVVKETQSRDGLLGSVLSALWGACDQIHHVAESLSGLSLLKTWELTQWDTCVDPGAKSRIWRLLSKQEKLEREWLFPFDSWLWNILWQWVDYSGLLLLLLSLLLRQSQGPLTLALEASPCFARRWEQSILPLISNSGQIVVGRLKLLAKWESASLRAQLSILVLSPSAGHPELTVC